jgi:hypothetical protein
MATDRGADGDGAWVSGARVDAVGVAATVAAGPEVAADTDGLLSAAGVGRGVVSQPVTGSIATIRATVTIPSGRILVNREPIAGPRRAADRPRHSTLVVSLAQQRSPRSMRGP